MSSKIKIAFVIPTLGAGGAQRIMAFVAQNLNSEKFHVSLLVIGFEKDNKYEVNNVEVHYFNQSRVLSGLGPICNYIKKYKPQIMVSSLVHLNTMMAFISLFFRKTIFVAREANVLSVLKHYNSSNKIYTKKPVVVTAYKLIDHMICQSNDMMNDMIENYFVNPRKITLINNPITQNLEVKQLPKPNNTLKCITIARLSKEKGHERIIQALSLLDISFEYTIIGSGNEKDAIVQQLKELNLFAFVNFIEHTHDIQRYLSESDIFLQGSYVEGLPNAVIESCLVGTPVVAFKAPGGIDEIIEDSQNGYVVETIEEFANYLNYLHTDFTYQPDKVSSIVREKFAPAKILKQYELLFTKLIDTKYES